MIALRTWPSNTSKFSCGFFASEGDEYEQWYILLLKQYCFCFFCSSKFISYKDLVFICFLWNSWKGYTYIVCLFWYQLDSAIKGTTEVTVEVISWYQLESAIILNPETQSQRRSWGWPLIKKREGFLSFPVPFLLLGGNKVARNFMDHDIHVKHLFLHYRIQ